MKIALVNTYDAVGGAAIACRRLMSALNKSDEIQASFLVAKGQNKDKHIFHLENNFLQQQLGNARIAYERLTFKPYHNGTINPFYFSSANIGLDISKHPVIQSADIIHLHWINLGFLSINSLKKLSLLGKPIVWTLHDMWTFTGGCHYSHGCTNYFTGCGNCATFLKHPRTNDLSRKLNFQKLFFKNFHFVTCSHWLKNEALNSSLLKETNVISIPNPIDTDFFKPEDKSIARAKLGLRNDVQYILFGAANLNDERKGIKFLLETIEIFAKHIDHHSTELLLFGKSNKEDLDISLKVNELGSIESMEKMRDIYNASDLFIIPSLQDNLPNTIMESMACGVPVVGFNTGGIPEMVDHLENGYIAAYKDTYDMAKGIQLTLLKNETFRINARKKVMLNYTEEIVSAKYISHYQSLI